MGYGGDYGIEMGIITLSNKSYSFEAIAHCPKQIAWDTLTPYETEVLQFCRRWLTGQQRFTVNSSGSTGRPKTITLSRTQMQTSARLTGQVLGLQAGDKALVCLSVEYIAGMMMLVRGFELGLRLTVVEPMSNPLAKFSTDSHFDFTALVPLQLRQILTDAPEKRPLLNRLKAILIGGAPVSAPLFSQLQAITAPIYHTYGMTETVTHVALRRLNGPLASDYFTPLPGVRLGLDERGCLTIQSAVTNNRLIHTNDLVELQANGSFKWLGRIDHVINSGGVKVRIEQVETVLDKVFHSYSNSDLAQRRFFVGPVGHERLGQSVVAVIEGPPISAETETAIRSALLQSLNKYEIPRHFYFVEKLLETPTGKIDRLANLNKLREEKIYA